MLYFLTPSCSIIRNPRVASMATAQAIVQTFYPKESLSTPLDFYDAVPTSDEPEGKVYVLIRDPIERFISAVTVLELDLETAISGLGNGLELNEHFAPQSNFIFDRAFQYPAQVADFCAAIGVDALPLVNESQNKPVLTDEQLAILQAFYADDMRLYNGIS